MTTNNKKNALVMCECAIMIALAAVLSFVKILELPYGGSVTAFSIVPMKSIGNKIFISVCFFILVKYKKNADDNSPAFQFF